MTDRTAAALSDRQRRIFKFVAEHIGEKGYAPSVREITVATGISSTSVVEYNIARLEAKGYLLRQEGIARGLILRKSLSDLPN